MTRFKDYNEVNELLKRDNAQILIKKEDFIEPPKLILNINFKCSCGDICYKKLSQIIVTGSFCRKCSLKNGVEKIKKKILEKYGVDNISKSEIIKKRKKETLNKNYDTPDKKKNIVEKKEITCLNKYGFKNPSQSDIIKEKKSLTFKKNYGVEHYFKTEECKERTKKLLLEKYGYEYISQIPEIQDKVMKNSHKTKIILDDNNNKRLFQGYEDIAFDELKKIFDLDDIITNRKDIYRIDYIFENKIFHYYCDFYIKSINKYIEIKSTWTIKKKKEKNIAKAKATIEKGYDYEFWIYDNKKNKTIITREILIDNNYNIDNYL
jgi:hypothetical protein